MQTTDFKKAIATMKRLGNKSVFPYLKFDSDGIHGTDGLTFLNYYIDGIEDEFYIETESLYTFTKSLKAADNLGIEYDIDNQTISIGDESTKINIPILEDEIQWPDIDETFELISYLSEDDTTALLKCSKYTVNDEYKEYAKVININKGESVASDGHRLIRLAISDPIDENKRCLIPASSIKLLPLSEYDLYKSKTYVKFVNDNTILITRLTDVTYPDYHAIWPTETDKECTLDRKTMIEAIKQTMSSWSKNITLSFDNNKMTIQSLDEEFQVKASTSVDIAECSNVEGFEISFNTKFILHALMTHDSETVTIRMTESNHAAIFSKDVLVMPVFIPKEEAA